MGDCATIRVRIKLACKHHLSGTTFNSFCHPPATLRLRSLHHYSTALSFRPYIPLKKDWSKYVLVRSISTTGSSPSLDLINPANVEQQLSDDSIVSVNPKPSKGFSSKLVDLLESLVVKHMHDASLPLNFLSSNFAPLRDETPLIKDLPVHGCLPVRAFTLFFSWV